MGSRRARPGFGRVVLLLLAASRRRAIGRRLRQRELLRHRTGKQSRDWGRLGGLVTLIVALWINLAAGILVEAAVKAGQRVEAEQRGLMVVDDWFADSVTRAWYRAFLSDAWSTERRQAEMQQDVGREAASLASSFGENRAAVEDRLRTAIRDGRIYRMTVEATVSPGLPALPRSGLPAMLGCLIFLAWLLMLVLQGEGLELDVQRRRHPMWEWLFSHPVPPGAVFLAEMLAPLAANPFYRCAPVFTGFVYGEVYGASSGFLAAALVGVPVGVATACLGKAMEAAVTLRCAPRSRGALIGMMGWLGSVLSTLFVFGAFAIEPVATAVAGPLQGLAGLAWPWLGLFLGQRGDGSFSLPLGILSCAAASLVAIAGAVGFSVWSTRQGLTGRIGAADTAPQTRQRDRARYGREPLFRKELLWFARDRSALVQVILIPLTLAGYEVFNMRGLILGTRLAWNTVGGAGILLGTYFIAVLGPKSLASEGHALWIALTWPRGLEALLRAKARLWMILSSAVVGLALCGTAVAFPSDIAGIALLALGWALFARSMALKAVTLATVSPESGERGQVASGRQWAVQLGTLSFAVGVLTARWQLAVTGIVYSTVTAAAMWQNFRSRLPFLYDPWSEELPAAPSLMHAMIAISALVEVTAVLIVVAALIVGRAEVAAAQSLAYGLGALGVSLAVARFLAGRSVPFGQVWLWRRHEPVPAAPGPWHASRRPDHRRLALALLTGLGGGILLGLASRGYVAVLHRLPWTADLLDRSDASLDSVPHLRAALLVMAVAIAPLAEEYLFRGLLYRALAREWRGWQAVLGSAVFFAMYHPPLAWLPVCSLGILNALLFRRSGYLAPAVLLHMAYNAVVMA